MAFSDVSIDVVALSFIFGFYGLFVGFVAGGTFEPCTIASAFDVSDEECKAAFGAMAKGKAWPGANMVHTSVTA